MKSMGWRKEDASDFLDGALPNFSITALSFLPWGT